MIHVLSALLIVLAFTSGSHSQEKIPTPSLNLKDMSGRPLKLSSYRGKVVMLNFWATWCAPCRKETPDLIKWQREYKARGLQVIGITYPPQTVVEVKDFIREVKLNYPVAMGTEETKELFDKDGDVLPITEVINRKGEIVQVVKGILFPEEFEKVVKPLL